MKYGSRAWHFWQYQSDGRVRGIGGDVDKDAFYGTKERWDAFLGLGVRPVQTGAAVPEPAPAPAQTAAADPVRLHIAPNLGPMSCKGVKVWSPMRTRACSPAAGESSEDPCPTARQQRSAGRSGLTRFT